MKLTISDHLIEITVEGKELLQVYLVNVRIIEPFEV